MRAQTIAILGAVLALSLSVHAQEDQGRSIPALLKVEITLRGKGEPSHELSVDGVVAFQGVAIEKAPESLRERIGRSKGMVIFFNSAFLGELGIKTLDRLATIRNSTGQPCGFVDASKLTGEMKTEVLLLHRAAGDTAPTYYFGPRTTKDKTELAAVLRESGASRVILMGNGSNDQTTELFKLLESMNVEVVEADSKFRVHEPFNALQEPRQEKDPFLDR